MYKYVVCGLIIIIITLRGNILYLILPKNASRTAAGAEQHFLGDTSGDYFIDGAQSLG